MKLPLVFFASLLYLSTLVFIYWTHVQFIQVNVVFYAAIADIVIATFITGLVLFVFKTFQIMTHLEKSLLILSWLLGGYALAISLPTVIDRSLSFYILEKLDQRGGAIRQDGFENVFSKEYLYEHRLVDVRLTEQLESGTITIKDGCVHLTEKGQAIVKLSQYFRTHWLPKKRLLMDEYTDDLTKPFRDSTSDVHYLCK